MLRPRIISTLLAPLVAILLLGTPSVDAGPLGIGDDDSEKGPMNYPMIGDHTGVEGMLPFKVEGVGLVIGLNETGSDPAPNRYREQMLEYMRKKDCYKPEEMLGSMKTSIVLLRAYIPSGARKGDPLDVEVWVPPGDSTTSLKGGFLLEAELFQNAVANGREIAGEMNAKVEGPVVVWENSEGKEGGSALLRKGKVLGQGRATRDRDFLIILERGERSARKTKLMAQRINQRFYTNDRGQRVGLASAKDEKMIELKLASQYRYDIDRYLLVLRRIPISSSPTFEAHALQLLEDQLKNPAAAIEAGLRLEALGPASVPVLKRSLESRSELVRFVSAQSLAYLGDSSGVSELARLAESSQLYRGYALAALVALDHPVSRITLGKLLHAEGAETRYGAFRALWSYDPLDPTIRGKDLGSAFSLHLIDSQAKPMVHLSRNFRREIVLFNPQQQLLTPFSLRAGSFIILNADRGAERVHLASFRPTDKGVVRNRSECGPNLAEVINECVKLGASYTDVADLLQQAARNGNLMGRLEINAIPRSYRLSQLSAMAVGQEMIASNDAFKASSPQIYRGEEETQKSTEQPVQEASVNDDDMVTQESQKSSGNKDGKKKEYERTETAQKKTLFDVFRRPAN